MKDPLQTEKTPHEVLEVGLAASAAEVNAAYMRALQRRVPAHTAKAARDALCDPVKRAVIAVTQYDDGAVRQLEPCPLDEPALLSPDRRAAAVAAWEASLRKQFPNPATVHSLGVLWYWWALYEEARYEALRRAAGDGQTSSVTELTKDALLQRACAASGTKCDLSARQHCTQVACAFRQDCRSSTLPLEHMWQRVIAYWAMLGTLGAEWPVSPGFSREQIDESVRTVLKSIRTRLGDLAQQHSGTKADVQGHDDAGSNACATMYHSLELALDLEQKTARAMSKAGIRSKNGPLRCGGLMLRQMGMLEVVRKQVDGALRKTPQSEYLKLVQGALSPYCAIIALLDNHQPDAALEAIERLSAAERASAEVARLRVEAHWQRGKQQVSLGRFSEALQSWSEALHQPGCTEHAAEIRTDVVSTAKARSIAIHRQDPAAAIAILEQALELVADDTLNATLAEFLTQQGIDIFVTAQREAEQNDQGATPETIQAFERGLALLERAGKMGSPRAREQANVARNVIAQARSASAVPPKARALLQRAKDAADREDWDVAIQCLREALPVLEEPAISVCTSNLAALLTNRAVRDANLATEMWHAIAQQNHVAMGQYTSRHGEFAGIEVVRLLTSAQKDLSDAAKLDPDNKRTQENRRRLDNVFKSIQVEVERAANWHPSTDSRSTPLVTHTRLSWRDVPLWLYVVIVGVLLSLLKDVIGC